MSDGTRHPWDRTGHEAIFVSTVWSAVERAAKGDENAQEELYRKYVYPMYGYLRRKGCSPQDAEDLLQTLFQKLFAREKLAELSSDKGCLRTWLLRCVDNLLLDQIKKRDARKRGDGQSIVSWDALDAEKRYLLEPADPHLPERQFDRKWAQETMQSAVARLEREFEGAENRQRFDALKGLLVADEQPGPYSQTAQRLGISEQAVKGAVFRLRRRLRELVFEEVALTVQSADDVKEEVRYLYEVLCA